MHRKSERYSRDGGCGMITPDYSIESPFADQPPDPPTRKSPRCCGGVGGGAVPDGVCTCDTVCQKIPGLQFGKPLRRAIDWAVVIGSSAHCAPIIIRRRRCGRSAVLRACRLAGVNLAMMNDYGVGRAWLARRGRGPEWAMVSVVVLPADRLRAFERGGAI